jgi:hypothetical protein
MRTRGRPLWRIRHELFWSELFARLAGPERLGSPRFDMHAELARIYFELAEEYRRRGELQRAKEAEQRAENHALNSEPPELPPAVANAASVGDTRYHRTDARGKTTPN